MSLSDLLYLFVAVILQEYCNLNMPNSIPKHKLCVPKQTHNTYRPFHLRQAIFGPSIRGLYGS